MTAHRARYAKIRELTCNLLARFSVTAPSVPIPAMLRQSGIELGFGELGEVSGLIARKGSQTVVGINSKQAPTRQRFTMAHEFGHFLLHQDLKSHKDVSFRVKFRDRKSSDATDVEEIEANFFAANLLVPRPFLDALKAEKAMDDDEEVRRLADLFEVSGHAMSLRLINEYGHQRPF